MRISLSPSPVCGWGTLPQPRSSRMTMAYMRALAGASAATRARMNFLDLKAGDRRSVCHRTTATILPRAVLLALCDR